MCLTDMGMEFGVVDSMDCWPQFFGHRSSDHHGPGPFLFPNAMQVPGLIHLADIVIRHALGTVPWWTDLEATMKVALQFLHVRAHRDRMIHALGLGSAADKGALALALDKSPD